MTAVPPNMPVPVYPPFLEPVPVPRGAQAVSDFGVCRVGENIGNIWRVGRFVPVETGRALGEPFTGHPSNRDAGSIFNSNSEESRGMIHAG